MFLIQFLQHAFMYHYKLPICCRIYSTSCMTLDHLSGILVEMRIDSQMFLKLLSNFIFWMEISCFISLATKCWFPECMHITIVGFLNACTSQKTMCSISIIGADIPYKNEHLCGLCTCTPLLTQQQMCLIQFCILVISMYLAYVAFPQIAFCLCLVLCNIDSI